MIWNDDLESLEKKEKIDIICNDLLEKLSNIKDWKKIGNDNNGVTHKDYNLDVYEHRITSPKNIIIPRKWRKRIRFQIEKIYHHYEMESLSFLHDVILDKYPLHVRITDGEQREWIKENANENDYITTDYWYYFKNEEIAVAYKLTWL